MHDSLYFFTFRLRSGLQSLVLLITFSIAGTSEFLHADIIAHWRFEEGSAGQAATGAGAILDSSGNGHSGTPINSPTYSSNVPLNPLATGASNAESLAFNGGNRVFVSDASAFQLTQSLTLEAFIFASASPVGFNQQIVFRGDDRGGLDPYFLMLTDSGTGPLAVFNIQDDTNANAAVFAPLPSLNAWHHLAGTLDGVSGAMKLFIDGSEVASINTAVRPIGALTGANPGIGIGNVQSENFNQYFNGLIDEVRISNTALNTSQFLITSVPEPSSFILLALFALVPILHKARRSYLDRTLQD